MDRAPTEYFCTYFDHNYLPQGLAMHRSLMRVCPEAHLFIFCLSEEALAQLKIRRLSRATLIPLCDLETADPDLKRAKENRSRVEYIFTCTPCTCLHIFDRHAEINRLTYLDSDLFFFGGVEPIFAELGDASVTIIPHRFTSDRYLRYGRYNVGWLTFRRDANGLECLKWWRRQCLDWCYVRMEKTRYADQKYLDEWPRQFQGVHVLRHVGANLARWNIGNYRLSKRGDRVWVDDQPLIFFHFAGLKKIFSWLYRVEFATHWVVPGGIARRDIIKPYLAEIRDSYTLRQSKNGGKADGNGWASLAEFTEDVMRWGRAFLLLDFVTDFRGAPRQRRLQAAGNAGMASGQPDSKPTAAGTAPARYFCTSTDESFIPYCLALYRSLVRVCPRARVFILCLTDRCHELLAASNLPNATLVRIVDLETFDPDLSRAKEDRTWVEYVFTKKASLCLYIFDHNPNVDLLTYLDADMYFFDTIEPLFEELGDASIGIVPHGFRSPGYLPYGRYNAGWIMFRRDANALGCLRWWRAQCLDWCGNRIEEERYTDQKYLDQWPRLFEGVYRIEHKGANVAKWNMGNYTLSKHDGKLWVDEQPLLFFHYADFQQAFSWLFRPNCASHWQPFTKQARREIFGPYIAELRAAYGASLPPRRGRVGDTRRARTPRVLVNLLRFTRSLLLRDLIVVWRGRVL